MNRIKDIQDHYNISAKEMASKLKINAQYIYDLQNEKKKINEDFLVKIYDNLNINLNWFLSGEGSIERYDTTTKKLYKQMDKLPKNIKELYVKRLEIDLNSLKLFNYNSDMNNGNKNPTANNSKQHTKRKNS